jgi:excisionase family DNA binding protein
MSRLLTPAEAAEHLGVGEDTLRLIRKAGELPYVNIGRGTKRETPRFDPADLDAWLERRKKLACPSISAKKPRTARTPTISSSVVADFQAARARLLGEKRAK